MHLHFWPLPASPHYRRSRASPQLRTLRCWRRTEDQYRNTAFHIQTDPLRCTKSSGRASLTRSWRATDAACPDLPGFSWGRQGTRPRSPTYYQREPSYQSGLRLAYLAFTQCFDIALSLSALPHSYHLEQVSDWSSTAWSSEASGTHLRPWWHHSRTKASQTIIGWPFW